MRSANDHEEPRERGRGTKKSVVNNIYVSSFTCAIVPVVENNPLEPSFKDLYPLPEYTAVA